MSDTTRPYPASMICHHVFLPDEGDCLRCFTPRPSFDAAPLHPHPITVPCGRCAEQVPLLAATAAAEAVRAENERMRRFMARRTLDGEHTELEVYEETALCCVDGPPGHTQQEHHDASPCYDPDCLLDHPDGGPFPHPCDKDSSS